MYYNWGLTQSPYSKPAFASVSSPASDVFSLFQEAFFIADVLLVTCGGKRHVYANKTHFLRIISVLVVEIIRNVFTESVPGICLELKFLTFCRVYFTLTIC